MNLWRHCFTGKPIFLTSILPKFLRNYFKISYCSERFHFKFNKLVQFYIVHYINDGKWSTNLEEWKWRLAPEALGKRNKSNKNGSKGRRKKPPIVSRWRHMEEERKYTKGTYEFWSKQNKLEMRENYLVNVPSDLTLSLFQYANHKQSSTAHSWSLFQNKHPKQK